MAPTSPTTVLHGVPRDTLFRLVAPVLIPALHYLGLYTLNVALSKHKVIYSRSRIALAALAVVITSLGYITWLLLNPRSPLRRGAVAVMVLLSVYAPWHFLTKTDGDLTNEEILLVFVLATSVGFYVVWYAIVAAVALVTYTLGARSAAPARGSRPTHPARAGGAAPTHRRRVVVPAMIAVIVFVLFSLATASTKDQSSGDSAEAVHPFLRGVLGGRINPCPHKKSIEPLPFMWTDIMPRRFLNMHTGPERCTEQVALPYWPEEVAGQRLPSDGEGTAPMAFMDERTGVLYVAPTCAIVDGTQSAPEVFLIDARKNTMAQLDTIPFTRGVDFELRPVRDAWFKELRDTYGALSPNARVDTIRRETASRVDPPVRATWRLSVNEREFDARSSWTLPLQLPPRRSANMDEVDTAGTGGVQEDVTHLEVLYNLEHDGIRIDIDTLLKAASRATLDSDYDRLMAQALVDFAARIKASSGSTKATHIIALSTVTAHTTVRCGETSEHFAFPAKLRGEQTMSASPESPFGVEVRTVRPPPKRERPAGARHSTPVVVIFLDAAGRPTFNQYMPRTSRWLRKQRRERLAQRNKIQPTRSNWFEFPGMTTVGHSTLPNYGTFLAGINTMKNGHRLAEVNLFESLSSSAKSIVNDTLPRPIVFTGVTNGMCSGAAHDMLDIRSRYPLTATFGERLGPMDDVLMAPHCHVDYGALFSNYAGPYCLRRRCFDRTPVQRAIFAYSRSLIYQVLYRNANGDGSSLFHVTTSMHAHEGSRAVLGTMDVDTLHHLAVLDIMGVFHRAAVFIISDHGQHMGPIFELTRAGRMERPMPVFMMSLPASMLEAPRALVKGGGRDAFDEWSKPADVDTIAENEALVPLAAHDLHATWRDLLGLGPIVNPPDIVEPRLGQSVLRAVKPYASCAEAGAMDGLCMQDMICEGHIGW